MPTVLIQGRIAVQFEHLLRKELSDDWKVLCWNPEKNTVEEFPAMAYEADAIIGGRIPTDEWPKTPKLKLFQIPWTGYDFCSPDSMPLDIPVSNCFEHESTIAEYVLCAMLETNIGLREMDKRFRTEGWGGRQPGASLYHKEVRNQTLGIIGYGHIGKEIAKRAAAFDMRIIAIRRSQQDAVAPLDWIGTADQLDKLLSESDFVVVACDMNEETIGLIDVPQIAKMKPGGIIINVARGRIISEQALYNALKNQEIGGAVLDVWYNYIGNDGEEVSPANLPFGQLDNVILSAHESASAPEQVERRWKFVAENICRATDGKTPKNIVFVGSADTAS